MSSYAESRQGALQMMSLADLFPREEFTIMDRRRRASRTGLAWKSTHIWSRIFAVSE
ncbi:hypothetical protein [Mycolicibacterium fortuitum]|uniref:hypothetical protein n=1 Tax=Mycolicibacterium fortuitum TaxID=1766 RepID=UPI0013F63B37|nr:hypothetical protein [Mycolicibacterium fortuitum]